MTLILPSLLLVEEEELSVYRSLEISLRKLLVTKNTRQAEKITADR